MRDEADVGDIARRLGYQLRRVDMLSMGALQDRLSDIAVPPGRATALIFIARHPGCDQMELGHVLGINRASTMSAVNSLVDVGAVERRPGRDRRSNALHLTQYGHRLADEIVRVTAEHEQQFFGSLTVEERAELSRLLLKARDANDAVAPRITPTTRARLRRVK